MEPTFTFQQSGAAGFGLLVVLGVLWGIFTTIFWMICAWYAMRAHQRIAEAHRLIARNLEVICSRMTQPPPATHPAKPST